MSATNAPVPQSQALSACSEQPPQHERVTAPCEETSLPLSEDQPAIDKAELGRLHAFFELLDEWDRRLSISDLERNL
jgi:hypothetical protein